MYNQVKSPNFAKENQDKIIMRNPILYLIIIGVCILSSCNMQQRGSGALPKELVQAENIMYENPDSALHILQTMPIPSEKEAHATWALLLTQAKYKCFVDQSDSLVNIAHDYFMKGNNAQKKALVLYLKGGFLYDTNQYEKALIYYLEADKEVNKFSNNSLGYLINSHICMIYAYQKLYDYAIEYGWRANEYAMKSQNIEYMILSYIQIARANSDVHLYESIRCYEKAINLADKYNCPQMKATALFEVADKYCHSNVNNHQMALSYIKEAMEIKKTDQAYIILGDLYRKLNVIDSAYFYLSKAAKSSNIHTARSAYQALYYMNEKIGNYKEAVIYGENMWVMQDSINKIANNKALIEMQEKYNQQKVINEKNKAERRGLIILCISIGVIGIIVSFYQWKVLRQNKELEDNRKVLNDLNEQLAENQKKIAENEQRMEMAASVETADMTEELKEKEAAIENMRSQNETLKKNNQELLVKIEQREAILQEKSKETERLNVLVEKNAYLRKREIFLSNQLLKMDVMITKLKKEPNGFKESQWEELKEKTDALYDRYTERLLKKVPTLTTHDIHICCLIKLSFSNTAMADILGISPTSVSRQKQRLKERIVQQIGSLGENVLLDIWLKEF